jgi:hypothetical protein
MLAPRLRRGLDRRTLALRLDFRRADSRLQFQQLQLCVREFFAAGPVLRDAELVEAAALLQMMEQLLLDLGKLTPQRFGKLFDQCVYWIGFRKNKADSQQRKLEEKLILKLLSSASTEQSVGIYERVLPERWDIDMGDGTLPMRKALRAKCEQLSRVVSTE